MADIAFKRGDTRPKIVATLTQTTANVATAINLTTATSVKLNLKDSLTSAVGGGACVITTAASGIVTYTPQTTDTATVRTWNAEWEITWSDGGIETVPNGGYFTIDIVADLG